jgi:hypothetical protein
MNEDHREEARLLNAAVEALDAGDRRRRSTGPPLARHELLEPVPAHDVADPVYPNRPGAAPLAARLVFAATTLARTCSGAPLPGRTDRATIAVVVQQSDPNASSFQNAIYPSCTPRAES